MPYSSLQQFIDEIERQGELVRINEKVSTELEIAEIADRMCKQKDGGKALLFVNNGTDFPVLINGLGSVKRMKTALNVSDFDQIGQEIENLFKKMAGPKKGFMDKLKTLPELSKLSSYMPGSISGRGICQEVIHNEPDLSILPVLKTWSRDGGNFITFPQVITKDPKTGIRNVGMYRMQVMSKDTTAMHWHRHKVGARHYAEYKELGKKMPVAVALGGDPVYTYSAVAPLPDNVDEYMLAGFLRKQKVKMVKAITQDIEVPADADIVIEGYIDTSENFVWEGPFGDHTGFFSLADWYPLFHVTCITHRKNAIYPATVVGIPPMEDAYIARATERIFLSPIKLTMLPELYDMNIPDAGVAHNLTLVSIHKSFPGHANKIMSSLWGAGQMMFNKMLVVLDKDINVHDYLSVAKRLSENVEPAQDISFSRGPLDILDHSSSKFAYGSKMCFDATSKYPEEITIENIPKIKPSETLPDLEKVKTLFPEIKEINTALLTLDISIVFISIEKNKKEHVKQLGEELSKIPEFTKVKFLIFLDFPVDVFDIEQATWIFANNIEPMRDCFIVEAGDENSCSHLIIDGTRKRSDIDNFKRDWPDIVTADEQTIKLVDEKWEKYGIGAFIESPSVKYKPLTMSKTEVVIN